jgi:squalene-hopene/tetraprenyl-beta-curcumene cyclase
MTKLQDVKAALAVTSEYLVSNQFEDGTWGGTVKSDTRTTAFYLNTIRNTGRSSDIVIQRMEIFLKQEQLECGAWEKWPGSGPDVEVTLVCSLSLADCATEEGIAARINAEEWLVEQEPPKLDSFWLGYLALNGPLAWSDTPHLSVRIVANPKWARPNIFDFSFLRLAVAATSLLQEEELRTRSTNIGPKHTATETLNASPFSAWIEAWLNNEAPVRLGPLDLLSKTWRAFDNAFPSKRKSKKAIDFLLQHQEEDGSFFSSVHMTSIAVVALHKLDSELYEPQIEAGIQALKQWHLEEDGVVSQQFTDSTTWDTILFLDLLQKIGGSDSKESIERSQNYLLEKQNFHKGDWSARANNANGGAWSFQRVGKWYPDCDDTAFASIALLTIEDERCRDAAIEGAKWLVSMQCTSGGWASWDRNDRIWMKIPNAGPWFARDLPTVDITSRVVLLLHRVIAENDYLDERLVERFRKALTRGVAWIESQHERGRWHGSWFTHYLYGTCHALEMLSEVDGVAHNKYGRLTTNWIRSIVNLDGGFGEAPDSGQELGYVTAKSTPFHTACGLLSLCYSGSASTETAQKAVEWLAKNQNSNGTWTNHDFFAAGVPGLWYANFSNTPTYFAAKSLNVYQAELERNRNG